MARPTKLTKDVQETIIKSIEEGLTYQQAAQMAGIDETTLYRWKRQGEKATSGIFYQFMQAVKKANVKARLTLLELIDQAGEGGQIIETANEVYDADGHLIRKSIVTKKQQPIWQASAWILERRFPDEFGRRAKPKQEDGKDPLQEWLDALVEAESDPVDSSN